MVPEQCRVMGYHLPAYFHTWINLEELKSEFEKRQVGNCLVEAPEYSLLLVLLTVI
jgi:hypothetical protein